ncbi:unnamed protein product [Ceutorhynchus assimilis]|uniref:Protein Abitram n=1 Tax=Ceutorhynchus assimilis TaxID=467358 RepID=A0A9N9ML45_9CUCU|nr:unnamed protein product [Ceutorhynchus assimilis]
MKSDHDKEIAAQIEKLTVPIIDSVSVEEIENFKPYYERYYENKYCTAFTSKTENNDILLRFHSNRLVLVSIAEGHDIIRLKKTIEKISFDVQGTNMLEIKISGKKKAGAKKLKKDSILCYIKCKEDDKEYPIYACLPASLIEVNQLVINEPQLAVSSNKELGYIAVLFPQCFGPKAESMDKMIAKLDFLTEDQYKKYLDSSTSNIIESGKANE